MPHADVPSGFENTFERTFDYDSAPRLPGRMMSASSVGSAPSPPNGFASEPATPANGLVSPPGSAPRPNILYIMADQMSAPLLKMHDPNSVIKTPNLDALAADGVVFESAYCNAPLCAPSRFCMVSGQLPSKIKAYDNASFLASDVPTYAHYLRKEGYETALAGKMHFIGPDQLHGFEHRLTSDIYPGDFGWSVNWDKPDERQEWYHNMSSVLQAGPCVRSNQLDFDEEVMYKSKQYLYDYVRQPESKKRPFCLTVSLTHPHDPYTMTEDYWDMYKDVDIPLPKVNIPQEDQDPHSKRILEAIELWGNNVPEEAILRARRAYYGACSYVDSQIGVLMNLLKASGLDQNTIVVFSGDHGDMLGERGLWYKMSWHEGSSRVPLVVYQPKLFAPRRVKESVSTLDLLPSFVDMVGGTLDTRIHLDGRSFHQYLVGGTAHDEVIGEYMGEGTVSPLMMIRRGNYKYTCCLADPPQLFDTNNDPHEVLDLCKSSKPEHVELAARFADEAARRWDLQKIHDETLMNQRARRVCWSGLRQGRFETWDYEPPNDGAKKYIRSTIPLDDLELRARFPVVDAMGRVTKHASAHGLAGAAGE